MRFSIYASPRSGHQMPSAEALRKGLEKHGHSAAVTQAGLEDDADVAVVWGWRTGRRIKQARPATEVLVMERSYIKDRFHWTSFGWNGLNGNASFFIPEMPAHNRFKLFFADQLEPERMGADYVLILGQVHGDASLLTCPDVDLWYKQQAHRWKSAGLRVFFRDHPKAKGKWAAEVPRLTGTLEAALAGAQLVIAWNSNALVDAALAGYPIQAGDGGTMAYPVANFVPGSSKFGNRFNRERWAEDLAWTQWTLDEVASGEAIPFILEGRNERPFHERRGLYNV